MAVDIGQLEVELADREAQGIRGRAQEQSTIGSMVGGAIQPGLQAAENIATLDESKRQDEATRAKNNIAANIKDEKGLIGIYELIKKEADAQLTGTELTGFSEGLQGAEGIENDAEFEKFVNEQNVRISEQNVRISGMKSQKARDDARKTLKGFEEQRISKAKAKKGAGGAKDIVDLRKQFSKEAKDMETILNQTRTLRAAFKAGAFVNPETGVENRVGSDQALIMTFNKILDPGSVVRESEFDRTGRSQGSVDAAKGWFQKLIEGGSGLTDDGRKAVFKMSELISKGVRTDLFHKIDEFERIGRISNVSDENIDLVVPGFSQHKEEYLKWKEDPEAYNKSVVEEINRELNAAKKGVVNKGKGKAKEATPKEQKVGRFTVRVKER